MALHSFVRINEVETSVSRKIEDALSNLEGVDYLVTKSLPNASIIIANLKYGTDLDKSMQDAQRYIDNIRKGLPQDILSPVMSKVSPNDLPIMSISATSNLSATEFYQKMKDDYLPQIQQIKGVAEITVLGGEEREISIKRPSLIIVLFSVFTLLGFIGYKNLSYELMPDFNQPVVVIKTVYPGAEPNEVETSVSRKIEDALS